MRERWPLWVLLASAVTFLVSLYLPWETTSTPPCTPSPFGCSSGGLNSDGWDQLGQVTGVLALGLVAGSLASLARPRLERRLPLGSCAFALGVFAILAVLEVRNATRAEAAFGSVTAHVAFGSYVALAAAIVACTCAIALRRHEFEHAISAAAIAGSALTAGVLAAFLIPPLTFHLTHVVRSGGLGYQQLSLDESLPVFILGLACFGLPLWTQGTATRARVAAATAITVLAGGYLSLYSGLPWPWELWLLLGCSLGLVALAFVTGRSLGIGRPPVAKLTIGVAGVLLLVSLFLPWERAYSMTGWQLPYTPTAGALTVLLLALLLGTSRLSGELAIGAAIYVMAAGFGITQFAGLEYGAPLGFAGIALLLVALVRQPLQLNRQRALMRLLPTLICAAFLAIPVLASTGRLPFQFELESPWRLYWLELTATLVALFLLGRWLIAPRTDPALIALPCALLALIALDLIEYRSQGLSWGGVISVALSLVLIALGWVERREGLETFSEIFRVDRIPEPDG